LARKGVRGADGEVRNDRPGDEPLDEQLWRDAQPALEGGATVERSYAVGNRDRSLGARLAGAIAVRHGDAGLPAGSIRLRFRGAAGQSFGAFTVAGMRLTLVGEAQDYVGKGMSGGELVVRPPEADDLSTDRSVILGNTALYGATGGGLFAAGGAGERLAVRNSGAVAVVEGCGDHGAEYMTGGAVVVLGPVGRNFGAGMSGGVAYLWDDGGIDAHVNPAMVGVGELDGTDLALLRGLVERHAALTGSRVAGAWLASGADPGRFRRVAPRAAEAGQIDPSTTGVEQAAARLSALGTTPPFVPPAPFSASR
jgi:glutamate synthase (ferredoxin)